MLNPTSFERRLLRGLAANSGDPDGWWSGTALAEAFPADFGSLKPQHISAVGRALVRHGFAYGRTRRNHTRQWQEWRIRTLGLGLVSDSCIGGGLAWTWDGGIPRCPACLTREDRMGLAVTAHAGAEIPAHPLPGYRAPARSA